MAVLFIFLVVNCKLGLDYPIYSMEYLNKYVRSDCMGCDG